MIPDDLNRLVRPRPPEKKLGTPEKPATLRAMTGLAASGRGEIASPLSETSRTHYATAATIVSSDGVFTITYNPIESVSFTDANGNPVVLQFLEPV